MALIPFGVKDGRLVDITRVERGLKCGCTCPSCGQRLVARMGEKTTPHFAHDKDADGQGTKTERCELSFFVALRLMIKQVLSECGFLDIRIPSLLATSNGQDNLGERMKVSVQVSKEHEFRITDINHQVVVDGVELDLVGLIGSVQFGLHFIYPGRARCEVGFTSRIGVIEIDLTKLEDIYENYDFSQGVPFETRVIEYLRVSLPAKRWLHHPNYKKAMDHAKSHLANDIANRNSANNEAMRLKQAKIDAEKAREKEWLESRRIELGNLRRTGDCYCVRCSVSWYFSQEGGSCPNCYMPGKLIQLPE